MCDPILEEGVECLCQSDPRINECLDGRLQAVLSLLNRYIEEIELFNSAYSLVGVKDRRELVVKHILDCLAPLGIIHGLLSKPSAIADVGSGAGLPGIPLAICLPDHSFTLIEHKRKRAGFLRNVQAVLSLSHVTVKEVDMDKHDPARFDLITFRAFSPLSDSMLKSLFRLLRSDGVIAAYKGRLLKVEDELRPLSYSGFKSAPTPLASVIGVTVPFLDEERCLVVMRI